MSTENSLTAEEQDACTTAEPLMAARSRRAPGTRHFAWIDVRRLEGEDLSSVLAAASTHELDAVLTDDLEVLRTLDPALRRVWFPRESADLAATAEHVDVVVRITDMAESAGAELQDAAGERAAFVDVHDAGSLAVACRAARTLPWTVITFADPTKIPLEIVLADADNATGRTITVVSDCEEAKIVFDVLEHGSDGVLLAPTTAEEVAMLGDLCRERIGPIELLELTVVGIEHLGAGDRACVDTCSLLKENEGMLIGSFSNALVLNCSETHPLPYMPTRPFRVNAGALHSYVLTSVERTNYLSELRSGDSVIAVSTDGVARRVVVGRVKIERRPLLQIYARGPANESVSLITQDDWHVRLLGPNGLVHNVTELRSGDVLIGYLPPQSRHVGIPVDEFCVER